MDMRSFYFIVISEFTVDQKSGKIAKNITFFSAETDCLWLTEN